MKSSSAALVGKFSIFAIFVSMFLCALGQAQTVTGPTIAVSGTGEAAAVNPVTNKIYVPNIGSPNGTVEVIDGSTYKATGVTVGQNPAATVVNPVTNKIYVANYGGNTVSVIDGATNAVTATVTVGTYPFAMAVNSVTNKIYVANLGSGNVGVIDGSTDNLITNVQAIWITLLPAA